MRVLLSTIGSRGEAQPVLALAAQLKELGQEAVVCAPPDFQETAASLGIAYVPVGPELHTTAKSTGAVFPPEQRRQMIEGTIADQFAAVGPAAEGCDVIVAGGALAIAAHSVAEQRGIRYVYGAFAPITLPSPHHAPPVFGSLGQKPADGTVDNRTLWAQDAQRWNAMWSAALDARREAAGLGPAGDVSRYLFTDTPWLAADPTLAPWPRPSELDVFQTGAWTLPDRRPLSPELERFLDAGEPPLYFGFGSMRAPEGITRTIAETARALGRRAILARGWAGLSLDEAAPGFLTIGEVNQQALFPRVAAVVHHGGAGTTTAAAAAGAPQVIVPRMFDQFYFARRVDALGIGSAHPAGDPSAGSLTAALRRALDPQVARTAHGLADRVRTDGALTAARRLVAAG
ncbi:glycosyl transferase [Streptomyces eurocidicus]|uniref:Glycosyl transferase n=1 Tax=Streptomyces eurocidicus TaxID=66423 RepID=A0A2N8NV52_STREU|nr:glycosyltransferase [Streptomyces eurocidicus]MBB5120240.1 vancomycin aglycone glucosyltransferase [Streptomyces eurocidicus]MBF6056077.1 glycosyltransferase [Streptomyces eurocidicus]PNE32657.1 glycosyl transferase [Streptomyces eurocidicus]